MYFRSGMIMGIITKNLNSKGERAFFIRWFGIGLIAHLILAWFSIGFYHYDEHYQILEFAGYKAGTIPASALAWEFAAHIRSAFQPLIAFVVLKIMNFVSVDDPFIASTLLRLCSALLGWFSMALFTLSLLPMIGNKTLRKWLILLSCFMPALVFIHVRFSSESWAGSFAFLAVSILLFLIPDTKNSTRSKQAMWLLFSGFLLGLAYLCRVQALFFYPGLFLFLFFIAKMPVKNLLIICLGIGLAVALGFAIDRWFYGEWVNTTWQYIDQNIIQGKAAHFGTEPWYWYFICFATFGPVPLQAIAILFIVFAFIKSPKNLIIWIVIPFLLAHIFVSHKEFRFLFPLVDGLPFLIILGMDNLISLPFIQKIRSTSLISSLKIAWGIFIFYNITLIMQMCTNPPGPYLYSMHYIYKNYHEPVDVYTNDSNLYNVMNPILGMDYYKRPNAHYINIMNRDSLLRTVKNDKRTSLIMRTGFGFGFDVCSSKIAPYTVPIYFQFPAFLKDFNFNHWADRTHFWRVYRLKDKE